MKILIAVDGSRHSTAAVESVIEHAGWYRDRLQIELVTVQPAHAEASAAPLAMAKKRLDTARFSYEARVLAGNVAESIVKHARRSRCDLICMGSRGLGGLKGALLGSVATRVLHIADRPVMIMR